MIDREIGSNPKLVRLHRMIRDRVARWRGQTQEDADALMTWIDVAIADWSRDERRRRKARKRRR